MEEKSPETISEESSYSYTLSQIAEWELRNATSQVTLPSLQRDLVWKPSQIELLWDSILRQFPIGSFILEDKGDKRLLLDGQQRSNTIALGFDRYIVNGGSSHEQNTALWLDLAPNFPNNSTRKFLVKVTSMAHPWGYNNDDECKIITASDRVQALTQYGFNKGENIYNTSIPLHKTWPIKATLPIPLYILTNATTDKGIDNFINSLKSGLADYYQLNTKYKDVFKQKIEERLENKDSHIFESFCTLSRYRVGINILSSETSEKESSEEQANSENLSNIEVLFARLGTGGTRITQTDLSYSAIKSYWGEIKSENERIAKYIMPPQSLIMLSFRLVVTDLQKKEDGFAAPLLLKSIREMATKEIEYDAITNLYNINSGSSIINTIVEQVERWIIGDKEDLNHTPYIIRTGISRQYPEIYLLLLSFAKRINCDNEASECDSSIFKAMALCLMLYCKDVPKTVNLIYKHCLGKGAITLINIVNAIFEATYREYMRAIVDPNTYTWENLSKPEIHNQYWELFGAWWNRSNRNINMLYYAQRSYLNARFKNYDPAHSGFWEEHNRPWDLDHIIPQNWVKYKKSNLRGEALSWLWNIGNCAAIPFELNRAKSDNANWGEYRANKDGLMFCSKMESVERGFVHEIDQVKQFERLVFNRSLEIYQRFYIDVVIPLKLNEMELNKSTTLGKRKEFLNHIKDELGADGSLYYVAGNMQYSVSTETDWCAPWISAGVSLNDKLYACICTRDMLTFEIGIRKHPNDSNIDANYDKVVIEKIAQKSEMEIMPNNDWWYLVKTNNKSDILLEQLKRLITIGRDTLQESPGDGIKV